MLLMAVMIVMIVSVALLLALFSGFLPFMRMNTSVMEYTTAYYGAISALERGILAVRYAGPGFDGESGWKSQSDGNPVSIGNQGDKRQDSFYTYGNGNDSLFWKVRSSTDRIPARGQGNVEVAFVSGSRDFNMLNYSTTELIPL